MAASRQLLPDATWPTRSRRMGARWGQFRMRKILFLAFLVQISKASIAAAMAIRQHPCRQLAGRRLHRRQYRRLLAFRSHRQLWQRRHPGGRPERHQFRAPEFCESRLSSDQRQHRTDRRHLRRTIPGKTVCDGKLRDHVDGDYAAQCRANVPESQPDGRPGGKHRVELQSHLDGSLLGALANCVSTIKAGGINSAGEFTAPKSRRRSLKCEQSQIGQDRYPDRYRIRDQRRRPYRHQPSCDRRLRRRHQRQSHR